MRWYPWMMAATVTACSTSEKSTPVVAEASAPVSVAKVDHLAQALAELKKLAPDLALVDKWLTAAADATRAPYLSEWRDRKKLVHRTFDQLPLVQGLPAVDKAGPAYVAAFSLRDGHLRLNDAVKVLSLKGDVATIAQSLPRVDVYTASSTGVVLAKEGGARTTKVVVPRTALVSKPVTFDEVKALAATAQGAQRAAAELLLFALAPPEDRPALERTLLVSALELKVMDWVIAATALADNAITSADDFESIGAITHCVNGDARQRIGTASIALQSDKFSSADLNGFDCVQGLDPVGPTDPSDARDDCEDRSDASPAAIAAENAERRAYLAKAGRLFEKNQAALLKKYPRTLVAIRARFEDSNGTYFHFRQTLINEEVGPCDNGIKVKETTVEALELSESDKPFTIWIDELDCDACAVGVVAAGDARAVESWLDKQTYAVEQFEGGQKVVPAPHESTAAVRLVAYGVVSPAN